MSAWDRFRRWWPRPDPAFDEAAYEARRQADIKAGRFVYVLSPAELEAVQDAERKAWARLVKATNALYMAAMMSATAAAVDPRSKDARSCAPERAAVAAAKQALCDLGVDVDALLESR